MHQILWKQFRIEKPFFVICFYPRRLYNNHCNGPWLGHSFRSVSGTKWVERKAKVLSHLAATNG